MYPNENRSVESLRNSELDFLIARYLKKAAFLFYQKDVCLLVIPAGANMLMGGRNMQIYSPSTRWAHGGPIIEQENLSIEFNGCIDGAAGYGPYYCAYYGFECSRDNQTTRWGTSPLQAAMKCIVAKNFGDEINIEEESQKLRKEIRIKALYARQEQAVS